MGPGTKGPDGMGIDAHSLGLLRFAADCQPLGRTVTIGRQEVGVSDDVARRLLGPDRPYRHHQWAEGLLTESFGATDVQSLDNSDYEGATLIHDMNRPLPDALAGGFDTVFDSGSLEHVFNIPQALANVSALCRTGGQVLHVLPANNFCGHGFWQVSPELFFSLYAPANGYRDTEVFLASTAHTSEWFRVLPPDGGRRVNIMSSSRIYALVRTVREGAAFSHRDVQQSDYVHAWGQAAPDAPRSARGTLGRLLDRIDPGAAQRLSRRNRNLVAVAPGTGKPL